MMSRLRTVALIAILTMGVWALIGQEGQAQTTYYYPGTTVNPRVTVNPYNPSTVYTSPYTTYYSAPRTYRFRRPVYTAPPIILNAPYGYGSTYQVPTQSYYYPNYSTYYYYRY
jgi:hypothetical protein